MPLYDYRCEMCRIEEERFALMAEREAQVCQRCGGPLTQIFKAQASYVPFNPYYDEGLGVEITGQDHRRRVMRELKVDHRDPPSRGELSARRDRVEQRRRNARHA